MQISAKSKKLVVKLGINIVLTSKLEYAKAKCKATTSTQ